LHSNGTLLRDAKSPVVKPGFFMSPIWLARAYFEMRSFDSLVPMVEKVDRIWVDEVR